MYNKIVLGMVILSGILSTGPGVQTLAPQNIKCNRPRRVFSYSFIIVITEFLLISNSEITSLLFISVVSKSEVTCYLCCSMELATFNFAAHLGVKPIEITQ
jgi:hypothetical protein